MPEADVLIVGGGPVGLAAAIEARLAGLRAVVVEPREGTIDKACGEGLMPGAVVAACRLGVFPSGHILAGISYQSASRHADHLFSAGSMGLGVRRTTLHDAFTERARTVGVDVIRDRVDQIDQDDEGVTAAGVRASWLLGCDGLHSTVRRLMRLSVESPSAAGRRFGYRRHFALAPWSDLVEVHWGDGFEAYVTPVAPDSVSVAILGPPHIDFDEAVAALPRLAERLHGAKAQALRAAGPLRQRTIRRTRGRVLLVGDASGYVDALTGEGVRVGLAQAREAIAAIRVGRPGLYEQGWRRATRDYRMLTSGLVQLATSCARNAIVPAAAALPRVYGAVVDRLAR